MEKHLLNIYRLGIKELRTLWKDKIMLFLIAYSFSFAIYVGATATSTELHNASIAFIDEDRTTLSNRIISGFYPPRFKTPEFISLSQMDKGMDNGLYTFVINIPSDFEKNVLSGRIPNIQVNIDATRMTQAGIGAGYIQQIIHQEINNFIAGSELPLSKIEIIPRFKFNPNLTSSWFGSIMEVINNIVMLSILLSGAATYTREGARYYRASSGNAFKCSGNYAFQDMVGKCYNFSRCSVFTFYYASGGIKCSHSRFDTFIFI